MTAATRTRPRRPGESMTPPALARRYGISVNKILGWIRSGQLEALNVASRQGGRPRWTVTPESLARFEAARSSAATVRLPRARRQRKPTDYREYV